MLNEESWTEIKRWSFEYFELFSNSSILCRVSSIRLERTSIALLPVSGCLVFIADLDEI